jgi:hypothetical protein
MAGDLAAGEAASAGEQVAGAERGKEIIDLAEHDLEAVVVEPHVPDDLGVEQADRVGGGRVAEARVEFLRHRRAADDVPALQHRHLQSLRGEIISADEAVMAGADDENVGVGGHGKRLQQGWPEQLGATNPSPVLDGRGQILRPPFPARAGRLPEGHPA